MAKSSLEQKLEALQQKGRQRSTDQAIASIDEAEEGGAAPAVKQRSKRQQRQALHNFQYSLFNDESSGLFETASLRPGTEFPSLFTRVPIFPVRRRGKKSKREDKDRAYQFVTSWGRGRVHGPPLNVYDEDTLIAIMRLRSQRIKGRPHHLPIPLSAYQAGLPMLPDDDVSVHLLVCTLTEIVQMCGEKGGKTNQLRLESIKRLGACVIEFDRQTRSKVGYRGTQMKILDIAWDVYDADAVLLIQIPPIMAQWLESDYTYIDPNIRRQLTDTGKALHRFFSSQRKNYEIHAEKLIDVIGYERSYSEFMRDLRSTLDRLVQLGWIEHKHISGTGRNQPHKLEFRRS